METKEITNSVEILKLFTSMQQRFPVFFLIEGKPQQIKILESNQQGVCISFPNSTLIPQERSLFVTNKGNLYHFTFNVKNIDSCQIELLYPTSLFISKAVRILKRFQASSTPLYITSIISQNMIPHELSNDSLQVQMIAKPYLQKLESLFSEVSIFIHERMDGITKLLSDTGKTIFIPDFKSPETIPDGFISLNQYIHLKQDSNKYRSEICVPLKYKNLVVFGYLQVLYIEKSDMNDYNVVLRVANKISKDLMNSNLFNDSKYKASILDISSIGLSFPHPQSKHFGKIFSLGGTIYFDLFDDTTNLGTFRAVVRDITPEEKMFRIGCQFFHISEEDKILLGLFKKYFPKIQIETEQRLAEIEKNRKTPKEKSEVILDALLEENETAPNIIKTGFPLV